jgi:hypothetical protein
MKYFFSHNRRINKVDNCKNANCFDAVIERDIIDELHVTTYARRIENKLYSQTCNHLFSTNHSCFSDNRQFAIADIPLCNTVEVIKIIPYKSPIGISKQQYIFLINNIRKYFKL